MTTSSKPDTEELIVKARFFANVDVSEDNLRKIQHELVRILQQEGYRQADPDPVPWGPTQRTMDFHLYDGIPIEEESSVRKRVKNLFGFGGGGEQREINKEEFLRGLERVRDDFPFRYIFYFRPYQDEDIEGYDIEVESVPALLRKYRQLSLGEDYGYNTNDIVDENKRELKRIMGKLGLEPLREPAIKSEIQEENQGMSSGPSTPFNQYNVTAQLQSMVEPDDQIHQDYQKAVREFDDGEYEDAIRDIGRAGEALIELLCADLYKEEDIPSNMNGRLSKLDNTEDGIPSYIGKTISPLWWLRNKVNHPTAYEITEDDAHYTLICFQIAVEKYVEEYSDVDVVY